MTPSEIKYMLIIYQDTNIDKGLRATDLVNKLGYSKVSVFKAINRLEEKNIVIKKDKKIFATDKGINEFAFYNKCLKGLISLFLRETGSEQRYIIEDVIKILGVMSRRNLESLTKSFN